MSDKHDKDNHAKKHDDEQPGTSQDANSRDSKKQTSKKQHFQIPDEKRIVRNRSTHQGPHRSRSSVDQNLKYKIYIRPKGQNVHQPSQLMKSLHINPNRHEIAKFIHNRKQSLISSFTNLTKEKHSRDHHNDVLFRPSHYLVYRRESLIELKKVFKRTKREHFVQQAKAVLPFSKRQHRCQNCLYSVSICNCHLPEEISKEKKSDWAILSQRQIFDGFQKPQSWTKNRLGWLEKIEANTKYDLKKLHNEVAIEQDVCCFPFSTLGIFGKQKMRVIDYYRKEPK